MSSANMLNDDLAINKINPYAGLNVFTPGVRHFGGPYLERLPWGPPEEEKPEPEEPSQGCYWARAAGTGMQESTVDYCTPKIGDCPLGRPREPQRHIDPGVLNLLAAKKEEEVVIAKEKANDNNDILIIGLALLALSIIFMTRKA